MPNEIIFLVSDSLEGRFEARALGHAVTVHFDEAARPAVIRLHFVREEVLAA